MQHITFGNTVIIITDRCPAFASKDFEERCIGEWIEHVPLTTGIPRGNGQVERILSIFIPVLSKQASDDPCKWFKFVLEAQRVVNNTSSRSTKYTPFELLTRTKMKDKDDLRIKEILNDEYLQFVMKDRNEIREDARKNIVRLQVENKRQFYQKPNIFKINVLVALQKSQFGSELKLLPKFYGLEQQ